jgi:hypothetical protein
VIRGQSEHFLAERVVDRYADVVNGWCWLLVETLVYPDGVWKLDRLERRRVSIHDFWNLGEEYDITAEDLDKVNQ